MGQGIRTEEPAVGTAVARFDAAELRAIIDRRVAWLEETKGDVLALASDYPDGYSVQEHRHSRSQLLHARCGVVVVRTGQGSWMVPPGHAMWIPAGIGHSVDMTGIVQMQSVYVSRDAIDALPQTLRVVALTPLVRSLLDEAVALPPTPCPTGRDGLVMGLLLQEIPRLKEIALGLPFPSEPRLAALCRRFLDRPSQEAMIDDWAVQLGVSRRTFTRRFQRETGVGLSTWRQQACLFAALPRLAAGEPVTSVALDLGYDSVPAFTTMFRRMLGAAPRDYLRRA